MAGGKEGEGGKESRPHLLAASLGLIHMAPWGGGEQSREEWAVGQDSDLGQITVPL